MFLPSFADSSGPGAGSALVPSQCLTLFLLRDENVLSMSSLEFFSLPSRTSSQLSSLPLWLLKARSIKMIFFPLFLVFVFCLFAFSRTAPAAYGGSQARGLIGAVATGLRQSHSNAGSEPSLQPTPKLTATPDT